MAHNKVAGWSVAIAVLAFAAGAHAQKPGEEPQQQQQPEFGPPTFGQVQLDTGFTPDPHRVNIREAGGYTPAPQITSDNNCRGYIYDAPDFVLNYTAGQQYPLNIYATSQADTTLVVREPGGTWACDDDSQGMNPLVRFQRPQSGSYHIWVGLYSQPGQGQPLPPADLFITELEPNWQ